MEKFTHIMAYTLLILVIAILGCFNISLSAKLDQAHDTINSLANANAKPDIDMQLTLHVVQEPQQRTFNSTEVLFKSKHALDTMSERELDRLAKIYEKAADTDYGLTLVAIAWKESRASSWPVNLDDPSCGPFHSKVTNVIRREGMEDTPFIRNVVCGKLINNMDFAIKHALYEIAYWEKQHAGNWRKILAGYNGGHAGNPKYAQEIAEIYTTIRNSNFLDLIRTT